MSNNFSDIFDWVMPDLPMAATPMVLNAIRDATIELCEKSLIWQQELQQILVLAPTTTNATNGATAAATTIVVDSITNFNNGDTLTILLTDGSSWRGHVSGTPSASTITLDGALTQNVDVGAVVTKLVYLYPITLPSGAAIAKGLRAWLNDNAIDPISPDDLDNEFNVTEFGWFGQNWRSDVALPTRFYFPDDSTIGLAMPPATAGNLRVLAALKPTRASTTFPTLIFEREVETIAHGAKARMFAVPKKPFSDKELAAYHAQMFNDGIANAKIRQARGNTRAPLRTHSVFNLR